MGFVAQEMPDLERTATDPSEPRVFTSVISDLKKSYPKEKMEEMRRKRGLAKF